MATKEKRKNIGFAYFVAILFFGLEHWFKLYLDNFTLPKKLFNVQSYYFILSEYRNTGSIFSILENHNVTFAIAGLVIVLLSIIQIYFTRSSVGRIGYSLIVAGGASNVLERILFGGVTDYIQIANSANDIVFFTFNVADLFIVLGALLITVHTLLGFKLFVFSKEKPSWLPGNDQ